MKKLVLGICTTIVIFIFTSCSSGHSKNSPPNDFLNAQFKCISGAQMSSELGTVGDFVAKVKKNGNEIKWKQEKKSWLLFINPEKNAEIIMNFVDWRDDKMYKCVWLNEVVVDRAMLDPQQIEGLIGSVR